ncbi:MAG: GAF domain-containing protein [Candidatus Binatia bacterium]
MADAAKESYQGLEEKISKRTQEIASLYAGLTPLAPADSIGRIFEKVIERLIEATGADAGLIRIRDKAKGIFVYTVQRGFPEYYLRVAARVPPGSAVDQVFTSGDPLISPDIASDPRHRGKVQLKVGLVSSALLPLQVGHEVRGIIHLASREKGYFSEEKREYLMAIARQMGIAMENRELFDGMKRLAQEQAVLNSIAMATSRSMDPDELLRISLDKLLEFTGRERGYTRLIDPVTGDLRLAAYRGISQEYAEALVHRRTPGGKADRIFTSGEPLVINDTEGTLLREDTRREGNRSIAWIPLKSKGKVVGVLNVSTARPVPFEPREVELLQAIGNVIGVALENSQLFEQTQRSLEVLKSTNRELERSTKEQRALRRFLSDLLLLDVNELLQKMTKQAARLFKAEYVWLRLFDDEGKMKTRAVAGEEDVIKTMSGIPEGGKLSGRGKWMLDHRRPLAVRDITQEAGKSSRGVAAGLRGFLGAPLFSREQKPLGVIRVMTRSPRDFGQRDLDLIEQFANGAAVALENAQLFEQMTLSQKELEKANRVKSYFLGMMSHELRTPLSVITGNIAILLEKRLGEINPEQEKRLAIIERNSADLFRMLQGILDICRLEEGKMPVHFEEFTVDGLLNEIRAEFAETPLNRRVRLEIHGNGAMRQMLSDRMKLKEILQNLVSNAIKFTKEGAIDVAVHYSSLDDRIEFAVQDTGIGMKREDLQHIFDVFYQVDSSDQRRFGGAGLGLNIVKRLVDLLQGEIRVESEPGKGSTFHVVVPRKIAVSPQAFLKAV